MAESEQKPMSKAITGGQQPVHNEAGDLVPGGAPPADVVSAPGISSSPQVKSSTMKRALPDSSALQLGFGRPRLVAEKLAHDDRPHEIQQLRVVA